MPPRQPPRPAPRPSKAPSRGAAKGGAARGGTAKGGAAKGGAKGGAKTGGVRKAAPAKAMPRGARQPVGRGATAEQLRQQRLMLDQQRRQREARWWAINQHALKDLHSRQHHAAGGEAIGTVLNADRRMRWRTSRAIGAITLLILAFFFTSMAIGAQSMGIAVLGFMCLAGCIAFFTIEHSARRFPQPVPAPPIIGQHRLEDLIVEDDPPRPAAVKEQAPGTIDALDDLFEPVQQAPQRGAAVAPPAAQGKPAEAEAQPKAAEATAAPRAAEPSGSLSEPGPEPELVRPFTASGEPVRPVKEPPAASAPPADADGPAIFTLPSEQERPLDEPAPAADAARPAEADGPAVFTLPSEQAAAQPGDADGPAIFTLPSERERSLDETGPPAEAGMRPVDTDGPEIFTLSAEQRRPLNEAEPLGEPEPPAQQSADTAAESAPPADPSGPAIFTLPSEQERPLDEPEPPAQQSTETAAAAPADPSGPAAFTLPSDQVGGDEVVAAPRNESTAPSKGPIAEAVTRLKAPPRQRAAGSRDLTTGDLAELLLSEQRLGGTDVTDVAATLIVADLQRSVEFYTDALGLTIADRTDEAAVLEAGFGKILLWERPDAPPGETGVMHLTFEVGDIDATFAEMNDAGVEFLHLPRTALLGKHYEMRAASFRDPDGHGLAITEHRERE